VRSLCITILHFGPARSANTALNVFKSSGISRRMVQRR
jgi:hypothetical protein